MGCIETIRADRFPKQGSFLGKRAEICFWYDTAHSFFGTIIRDDTEEPFVEIIQLDSGLVILSTECQYSIVHESVSEMLHRVKQHE